MSAVCRAQTGVIQWTPIDITWQASSDHNWWEFPVTATFTHIETDRQLQLEGFYDGAHRYVIRFAAPLPGRWRYETMSADDALAMRSGEIDGRDATEAEIAANPNLRGHLKLSGNGRYFEYADGTPFFLLADTAWSINTSRCGLGDDGDGPFFKYLSDRKAKQFTAILMSAMRGFGDTQEPFGQRNEGGYPFEGGDVHRLNPAFFAALDERMSAIWENGFIIGMHPTWFGKLNCVLDHQTAVRISRYLAVRYGAYNGLWSHSGEYQYSMRDCGWSADQISALGRAVAAHNPYGHPISIHPSGRTVWEDVHGQQSSRAFHESGWLDHHWLQTGQKANLMHNVPRRIFENRELTPQRPVFLAEAYYERVTDAEHSYHTRWQGWTAMLNGAAGYGCGTYGIWQFYDPQDPKGETGKKTPEVAPWHVALELEGTAQLQHVRSLLTGLCWWELKPCRDRLRVDGEAPPLPSPDDISPPHAARTPKGEWVIYLPRGHTNRQINARVAETHGNCDAPAAFWFDPRSGKRSSATVSITEAGVVRLSARPSDDDWVLVLHGGSLTQSE